MAFTIPNNADAAYPLQAAPDKVDVDILVAALNGNGVISGCAVTTSTLLSVTVAAGTVQVNNTQATVTGGDVTCGTADATNPRIDLVAVNSSGTKSIVAGTAAATAVMPAIPANSVILAALYIPALLTTIVAGDITDKRCIIPTTAASKHQRWIDAAEMIPRLTNGPSRGFTEQGTNKNNHETLDFDATTQEFAQFKRRMLKSWDLGTVTFIPIWTAASGSGGVVFALQGVATSNNDALDVAFGTEQTSTDTLLTASYEHEGPESSAITIGGTPVASDLVTFQVKRNPADGSDTLGVDAKLLGIILTITTTAANDA